LYSLVADRTLVALFQVSEGVLIFHHGDEIMAATDVVPQTQDIPFSVQGYVTDPKLVGYQILTNYESTYWAPLVGNDAWRLYEVLRSFCHEGKSTCYPSIRLLTVILGLKEKRVLTGWAKTVKGKEYQYPGLIEILQESQLAIAEVRGEGPKMRYIFHISMTPGLLTDKQLAKLPKILQTKHTELLQRCEKSQRELEAKRRPSKFQNGNRSSQKQGGGKLPPPGGNLPRGGGNLPPEQYQYNITNKTSEEKTISNNNTHKLTDEQNVVVALLQSHGISVNVAQKLTTQFDEGRIQKKIEYLKFLIDEDRVSAPAGWLRKAIEEDYAAPDGFVSTSEREKQEKQQQEKTREAARLQKEAEASVRERREQEQKQQDEFFTHLRKQYGTTDEDMAFGEKLQQELKLTDFSSMILADMSFLGLKENTAVIGIANAYSYSQLQHPGTQTFVKRALKYLTGRKVDLDIIQIGQQPNSVSG